MRATVAAPATRSGARAAVAGLRLRDPAGRGTLATRSVIRRTVSQLFGMPPMKTAGRALFVVISLLASDASAQSTPAAPVPHPVFHGPVATSLGAAQDVAFADVDGDGRDDLLAATAAAVTWRAGLGGGAFGAPTAVPASGGLAVLEPCDLDGDGHLDLVGATPGEAGFLRVAFGDGSGAFGAPTTYTFSAISWFGYTELVAADADGDGDVDLTLSVASDLLDPDGGYLALYLNDGSGALLPELPGVPLLEGSLGRAADFDGDGLADLLVSAFTGLGPSVTHRVLLGQPGGGFAEAAPLMGSDAVRAAIVDLDADGHPDVVAASPLGCSTWLGAGDGSFNRIQSHALGFVPAAFDSADVDGDGHLDLAAFHWNDAWILRGAGDGTTAVAAAASLDGTTPGLAGSQRLVELDGDGKPDLALARSLGTPDADVRAASNATYAAGGPLTDFGGSIRGVGGFPVQVVAGTLAPGSPFTVALDRGKPAGQASWVLGLDALFTPFKGGVLVPRLDAIIGPLPLDDAGSLDLAFTWPAGFPAGQAIDGQFWIKDAFGLLGFAATTDVHMVQP